MTSEKEYLFDDVRDLIKYLFQHYGALSPLKLQKGLYFLFAYYGAMYGKNRENEKSAEIGYTFPKYLFQADFEAWNYGPVIRDVYFENKRGSYNRFVDDEEKIDIPSEIEAFINELFVQIKNTSDFSLVDRSHEDVTWEKAHQNGRSTMPVEDIIDEYSKEYI